MYSGWVGYRAGYSEDVYVLARKGLTIANNYISSIDNDEERVIQSKSENKEIMINHKADEVIK